MKQVFWFWITVIVLLIAYILALPPELRMILLGD
jgi:hypothetical protein